MFALKTRPKSVWKDTAVYALTFLWACLCFEMVFMMILEIEISGQLKIIVVAFLV